MLAKSPIAGWRQVIRACPWIPLALYRCGRTDLHARQAVEVSRALADMYGREPSELMHAPNMAAWRRPVCGATELQCIAKRISQQVPVYGAVTIVRPCGSRLVANVLAQPFRVGEYYYLPAYEQPLCEMPEVSFRMVLGLVAREYVSKN